MGMLILTRRTGETLMIGNEVTLTVLGVKGNQVRIGINAPKNVPVHREEIYERIKRQTGSGVVGTLDETRQAEAAQLPSSPATAAVRVVHSPQCDCQVCMAKDVRKLDY